MINRVGGVTTGLCVDVILPCIVDQTLMNFTMPSVGVRVQTILTEFVQDPIFSFEDDVYAVLNPNTTDFTVKSYMLSAMLQAHSHLTNREWGDKVTGPTPINGDGYEDDRSVASTDGDTGFVFA